MLECQGRKYCTQTQMISNKLGRFWALSITPMSSLNIVKIGLAREIYVMRLCANNNLTFSLKRLVARSWFAMPLCTGSNNSLPDFSLLRQICPSIQLQENGCHGDDPLLYFTAGLPTELYSCFVYSKWTVAQHFKRQLSGKGLPNLLLQVWKD